MRSDHVDIDEMRVAQFVHSLAASDGGPSRHALEVNLALNKAGARVQLLSISRRTSDSVINGAFSEEGSAPRPWFVRDALLRAPRTVLRTLFGSECWIVHGYFLPWVPAAVVLGWTLRKRVLLMPHGALTAFDRSNSRVKKSIFHILGGWVVDRVAHFAVASALEEEELPRGIARRRVHVVGAGTQLLDRSYSARVLREPTVLLSLSRLAPKKRIDLSIGALAELRATGVDARLVVAGEGADDFVRDLHRLAQEKRVADHIDFLGAVGGNMKDDVFASADIFLLPSDDENFGIALSEALATGLPVVTTAAVGAADGLTDLEGRVLISPGPREIADAVMEILPSYEQHAIAARRFAEAKFRWDAVAERWLAALRAPVRSDKQRGETKASQ